MKKDVVIGTLTKYMTINDITVLELTAAMCMSYRTWRRRVERPEEFTVGELKRAKRKLKIPDGELIAI